MTWTRLPGKSIRKKGERIDERTSHPQLVLSGLRGIGPIPSDEELLFRSPLEGLTSGSFRRSGKFRLKERLMKKTGITLSDVVGVYSGPEGRLWELVMGEQIHAGGYLSSLELARRGGIKEGMKGVDLCCCLGAGMRFLVKNFKVDMAGVDATEHVLDVAQKRGEAEGLSDKLEFAKGDVTQVPYPDGTFDFVWGEDAWCYVTDKEKLIAEAARILKSGGVIAFTDWIEGREGLTDEEAQRINTFMKFPYMESVEGYTKLLESNGFRIVENAEIDFARYLDLYIAMLTDQYTYDALRIIGDDMDLFQTMGGEMDFMRQKAHQGKMVRGRFVGVKE